MVDTKICNVVAHPKQFGHKRVRVRAQLLRGMHGSALSDENCKRGFAFWIAKDAENHPDFQALDDIFRHGSLSTSDKTIVGTFSGRFLGKKKIPGTHRRVFVLEVDKVEDLDVKYDNPQIGRE